MSGQSANLTLKEAKAMQERTQCGENSQGSKKSSSSKEPTELMKKEKY